MSWEGWYGGWYGWRGMIWGMIWLERDDMRDDIAWRGMIWGMIWVLVWAHIIPHIIPLYRDDMGDDMGFDMGPYHPPYHPSKPISSPISSLKTHIIPHIIPLNPIRLLFVPKNTPGCISSFKNTNRWRRALFQELVGLFFCLIYLLMLFTRARYIWKKISRTGRIVSFLIFLISYFYKRLHQTW